MIEAVIFDFGNVLGWTYADHTTATFVDDEEARNLIRPVVFDPVYWDQLNRGTMSDEELLKEICNRLPMQLHREACTVYENWINSMTPVRGMARLICDLKEKGYKLYLLSNATMGFAKGYTTIPWMRSVLEQFDGLVFSAEVGMAKPDREIFEYILKKYNLTAENCLFVDDYKDNIEAAQNLGINGHLFEGDVTRLRQTLGL